MSETTDYLESLLFSGDDKPTDYTKSPDYVEDREYYHKWNQCVDSPETEDIVDDKLEKEYINKAAESIDRELEVHPNSPFAHYLKVYIHKAQGNYTADKILTKHLMEALDLFEEQGDESEEYNNLVLDVMSGYIPTDKNSGLPAILAYTLAKKNPTTGNLVRWGIQAANNKMYGKAIRAYRAALAAKREMDDPDKDVIYGHYIIPTILHYGDIEEAKKVLAEAEMVCPDGRETCFARVYFLAIEKHYEEALDLILETIFLAKDDDEEDDEYNEYLQDNENGFKWRFIIKYISEFAHDIAIEKFEKFANRLDASVQALIYATNLSRGDAKNFFRLKKKCHMRGIQGDDVCDGYDEEVERLQFYRDAYAFDKLLTEVEKIERMRENNPPSRIAEISMAIDDYTRAACLAAMGDIDAAETEINNIEKQNPDDWQPLFMHAQILAKYTNRFAEAAKLAEAAMELTDMYEHYNRNAYECTFLAMLSNFCCGNTGDARVDAKDIIRTEAAADEKSKEDNKEKDSEDEIILSMEPYPLLWSNNTYSDRFSGYRYSCIAYAILGDKERALKAIDAIQAIEAIRAERTIGTSEPYPGEIEPDNYIHAAMACCILGMHSEGITYIGKALEAGEREFTYLERNQILAPLREMPEWAPLMKQYKAKHTFELEELEGCM